MPRANSLDIECLFNHRNTRILLEGGRIFLFGGDEGEGKSGILNSLTMAFTGRCRLDRVDGDKLTNDALWDAIAFDGRDPVKDTPGVTIALVGAGGRKGTLRRTRRSWSLKVEGDPNDPADGGTTITTKEELASFLGVRDLGAVEVALRSQRFMELDSDQKIRMIFAALGKPVTVEELREHDVTDPEIQKRVIARSVKSGLALATEKRRNAARDAELLEKPEPKERQVETAKGTTWVKDIPKSKIVEQIAKSEAEREEVLKAIGAVQAKPDLAAEKRLAKEAQIDREKAAAAWKEAKAALDVVLTCDEAKAAGLLRQEKAALTKTYRECQEEQAAWKGKVGTLKDAVLAAEERVKWIEARADMEGVSCPTCGHSASRKTLMEQFQADVEKQQAALAEAVGQVKDLERFETTTKAEGTRLANAIAAYDAKIEEAKAREAEYRTVKDAAEKAGLKADVALQDAAARLADTPKQSEEDLKAKDQALYQRIEKLHAIRQAIVERDSEWTEYAKAKEEAKGHRATEKRYAAMEKELDDSGFLSQRVEEPRTLLREKVAALAATAFRDPLPVEINDDFTVTLKGRPVEFASRGQQWLVGAVVAAAITSLTGFGVLVLDDLNMVGPRARDKVLGTLRRLAEAGEIEQVFIASIRDSRGWCDACGRVSAEDAKGCIRDKADGTRCGAAVGPMRPRGPMLGFLRTFVVAGGVVSEVAPIGQEVTA